MHDTRPTGTRRSAGLLCSAAAAAVAIAFSDGAHAQVAPATNIVSVCSGVALPRSAVTDIMRPVIGGVVTPIENTVNPILGVLGGALPLTPPLSIDTDTLLNNAAAGQPIRLQVLNTNGTLVGPGDPCEARADSLSLGTPAGIAIGGNRITGLGAANQEAYAATTDGIAFGNLSRSLAAGGIAFGDGATVDAAGTGAVAIGQGARATTAGSVALGAGSLTSRGVPEVSVGAPGAERIITNVAAGVQPTDAVNMGQYTTLAGTVSALGDAAVVYDDPIARNRVTFAGAAGTTLANVAPGDVSASSREAVNGSQLYSTNQLVQGNTTAITNLSTQIANGSLGPVRYVDASGIPAGSPTNSVALVGGASGPVTLGNVAAGSVAAGSTDAVNGSQLSATNDRVSATEAAVAGLDGRVTANTDAIATANGRIDGVDARTTANTAAIATVNGRVDGVEGRVGTAETQIATLGGRIDATTQAIGDLGGRVSATEGGIAANTQAISGLDGRVSANEQAVVTLGDRVANGAVGPVQYSDPGSPEIPNGGTRTNDVTLVGAATGPVGMHNVADGRLAAGSTDAVNGGQIYAIANAAANAVSYDTDSNGGRTNTVTLAGADPASSVKVTNVADGTVAAGSTDAVTGSQLASTNSAVATAQTTADTALNRADRAQTTADGAAADAARAQGTADVALGSATRAQTMASAASAGAARAQTTADTALSMGRNSVQYDPGQTAVTLNPGESAVTIHNVAAGTAPTDAVNMSQLGTGLTQTLAQAKSYTDGRFAAIAFDLKSVRRDAYAGSATALAAAGLPQAYEPGKGMISLGGGTYAGQSAIAIGLSKAFEDGHTVIRIAGSRDTQGRTGVNGGVGYQF